MTTRADAAGRMRMPVCSGVKPRENCRNWVSTNSAPYRPKVTVATAGIAAENERCRKKPRLSMGCEVVLSQTANRARMARPPAPAAMTRPSVQPRVGASMIDHRIAPMPAMDRTAPVTSGARAAVFLESGTRKMAAMRPAAAMGTLIRKTEPHQKWLSSRPPMIGPSATPMPLVPAHRLIAR